VRLLSRLSLLLCILAVVASTANSADFTTYIGDVNQYQVAALTTDAAGNTYVTGGRVIQMPSGATPTDVFVTKLDPAGNIVFTTTFGGKGSDQGAAIAVDAAGNIWVGGSTSSTNLPLHDALQADPGLGATGFLVKLASDGTVIYSSYFGGVKGTSSVNGIAIDPSGNVYLTGTTNSSDFATTPGLPTASVRPGLTAISGAFITKLDPSGAHIIYSALLAGTMVECESGSTCFLSDRSTRGAGIAIDQAGDAFIAGYSNTTDLPVAPGGISGYGAFAAKIDAAGNQLAYLTYLGPGAGFLTSYGPSETIGATAIAADAAGNAFVTGSTNDSMLPTTAGAFQTKLNADATEYYPPTDAFAVKLDPSGKLAWATYLGGPGNDSANSVSVDNAGNVWLAGSNADGFPSQSRFASGAAGDFLAELSADGSTLSYTAEFGTGGAGQALTIDSSGIAHIAGFTGLVSTITPSQPSTPRILGIANAAAGQVSGRIAPGEVISIYGFGLGPTTSVSAAPVNNPFPASLGGVQVLVNGSAIPLLYVSASQINAEIPAPLYDASATIRIINGSATLPDFRASVDDSIAGIFQNPDGSAKAINQDSTLNSPTNPAKAGTYVAIWTTGFSRSGGPSVTGTVATAANNWCSYCQISVGTVTETVAYAGDAPGLIDGVMQVNFLVPPQFAPTQVSVDFDGGFATLYVSP